MEVNSTLFIQIFNFGIAYICIRYLLLKPAVALILAERAKHNALVATLNEHRALLAQEELRKKEEWAAWQHEFASKAPTICVTSPEREHMPSAAIRKPNEPEIIKAAQEISAALIARVKHVQ